MEYVYYALFILAVLAVCVFLAGLPGRHRLAGRQVDLADRARRRREKVAGLDAEKSQKQFRKTRHHVLQRDLSQVPVPWGWPGHNNTPAIQDGEDGIATSLQRWVDHLVREKRTVDDAEFLSKRTESLKAMLEDRYGRASTMAAMPYRKTKAPLLRDPSAPHDQMDNFPGGKTASITTGLSRQPGPTGAPARSMGQRSKSAGLHDVRTPWGW
jgi:hypothetical protein